MSKLSINIVTPDFQFRERSRPVVVRDCNLRLGRASLLGAWRNGDAMAKVQDTAHETPEAVENARREIAELAGLCIMAWAAVERGLSLIYSECIGAGGGKQGDLLHISVFDSVIALQARRDMIKAALEWHRRRANWQKNSDARVHCDDVCTEWHKLSEIIKKQYEKRNQIAHSDISQTGLEGGGQRVGLQPYPTITYPFGKQADLFLSAQQLRMRIVEFEGITGRIVEFRNRVIGMRRLFSDLF